MVPGTIASCSLEDDLAPLDTLDDYVYQPVTPPPFIPASLGAASKFKEGLVLHLLNLFNARGRTLVSLFISIAYVSC